MKKIPQQAYTTEFKELAVKRVADGQTIPAAAKELGLSDQILRNCGACQGSCRLPHAAIGCLSMPSKCAQTTASRSGLSVTAPMGVQLRV
jgi:hypothetical protein